MFVGSQTVRRSSLRFVAGAAILLLAQPVSGDNRQEPAGIHALPGVAVAADVQPLVEADWLASDRQFGAPQAANADTVARGKLRTVLGSEMIRELKLK